MSEMEDIFGPPISVYTSEQATEDGVLFDITTLNEAWKQGLFRYVTANLLDQGYYIDSTEGSREINIPNLLDLLNQANQIVRRESKEYTVAEDIYIGTIELPSGESQKIMIGINEVGKYTIMLPEDY